MNFELFAPILGLAAKLWIVLDPPGNVGPVATLLSEYDVKTQNRILRREVLIALVTMLVFYFGGSYFLSALDVSTAAVKITGGIVFMMVGISILFPRPKKGDVKKDRQEPFIVPIAIPLIAGPSCLTILISYSHESIDTTVAVFAIILAWMGAAVFILAAPLLAKRLGKTGLKVAEQMIGVICVLIATQGIREGIEIFLAQ